MGTGGLGTVAARTTHSESQGFLDRFFKLTEHGTNVRTEVIAGLTTFVTMAYIIIVNPITLTNGTGMDFNAVFMATILAAAVSTLIMGLFANWPFALAPGMGLNAFFTFVLCGALGMPWQSALGAVLISGILALIVTLTGLRELMIKAIPQSLKHAVSAGIGFFIMLIGLKNAGIVNANPDTLVAIGDLTSPGPLLAIIGLIITAVLYAKNVKGSILLGMLITTVIGIPMGVTTLGEDFQLISAPPSLAPTFFQLSFEGLFTPAMITVIFSMFFADLFDTIGTFVGVAGKAGKIDEQGNLKGSNRALVADSLGTIIGSLFGTSNTTTYVESAAGVSAGGRTGLTAVVVAVLFLLSSFFSDIVLAVPGAATAPALIIVGILMASPLLEVDLGNFAIALPAIVTALMMPFTFSIATGLALGFVTYVVLNLLIGKGKEVHWMMYVLSVFFLYYFYAQ
jgi:AGZA family xanthine/uracil permease-like MFS transporter